MPDPTPPTGSARSNTEIPVQKPPWAFWRGLLTGVAIEIPAIAATVWIVARFGVGNPGVGFMPIMRLTAVFTGVAALFTAGGIGRLAAYTTVEKGRRKAIYAAMRAHAIASAGLVLIAAIPHGEIDFKQASWIALPIAGVVAGAICGAIIGSVCTGSAPVGYVLTKPSEALRQLLSPGDLVRLGSALRGRTRTLFDGIFDPAPPRPPAQPPDPTPPATGDGEDKPV